MLRVAVRAKWWLESYTRDRAVEIPVEFPVHRRVFQLDYLSLVLPQYQSKHWRTLGLYGSVLAPPGVFAAFRGFYLRSCRLGMGGSGHETWMPENLLEPRW